MDVMWSTIDTRFFAVPSTVSSNIIPKGIGGPNGEVMVDACFDTGDTLLIRSDLSKHLRTLLQFGGPSLQTPIGNSVAVNEVIGVANVLILPMVLWPKPNCRIRTSCAGGATGEVKRDHTVRLPEVLIKKELASMSHILMKFR